MIYVFDHMPFTKMIYMLGNNNNHIINMSNIANNMNNNNHLLGIQQLHPKDGVYQYREIDQSFLFVMLQNKIWYMLVKYLIQYKKNIDF